MDTPVDGLAAELKQTRPFDNPFAEATIGVLRTADVIRRRVAAVAEPHGVTPQQYNVLRILRGAHPDPLPTLEIGERLIERMPGITRLLDRLAEKGWVRRQRSSADRRLVHCWITDAGLALLAALDPDMDAVDASLGTALTVTEARDLTTLLTRIRHDPG